MAGYFVLTSGFLFQHIFLLRVLFREKKRWIETKGRNRLKWIKDLNIKAKTVKLLVEIQWKRFLTWAMHWFLGYDTKSTSNKSKQNKTKQIKPGISAVSSVQLLSRVRLFATPWIGHSTLGLPVHHHLPEFTQTRVHRVHDAIQPSHPQLSPSPPASNPSQHQSLFQWVNSSHEVAKVLEFQL